jgi:peptidyl-prolyl cis-trans isomerase A (cyclophilin A)
MRGEIQFSPSLLTEEMQTMKLSKTAAFLSVLALLCAFTAPVVSAQTSSAQKPILSSTSAVFMSALTLCCALAPVAVSAQTSTSTTNRTTQRRHMATGSLLNPASLHATAPAVFHVRFHTTKGDFTMEVVRAWAPNGADRFYNLVEHHFYDNAEFFRVLPGFVVQFGIPADPKYGKIWTNANIKDDPVKESNTPGYVTYAQSSAPNSRSTQLFINLGNNARLDGMRFAPFGKVTEGMSVVQSFNSQYGEQASGQQDRITNEGNAFLDSAFPGLDKIITARVVPAAPAHPATHTTPHPSSH